MDYVKWQSALILVMWCFNLIAQFWLPITDAAFLKMCAGNEIALLSIIALNVVWSRKK
ncbi:MAG: hypothetical protein IKJ07_07565 [Clostridia bacterium]|nr:hypothetical protein [Clostridia bacterium]